MKNLKVGQIIKCTETVADEHIESHSAGAWYELIEAHKDSFVIRTNQMRRHTLSYDYAAKYFDIKNPK